MFVKHLLDFPIHVGLASAASDYIIEDEIRAIKRRLENSSNTISIMRILTSTPDR